MFGQYNHPYKNLRYLFSVLSIVPAEMDLVYKFIHCISTKVCDDGERQGIMDKTMMCEAASRRVGRIDLYGYCISIFH